eukprot:1161487-Pelagomonas_calceolata.AAC.9
MADLCAWILLPFTSHLWWYLIQFSNGLMIGSAGIPNCLPAGRAVREMIAFGLNDPYCRFIQPSELQSMKKYDVTGVGLNLGTAEEYVLKTVGESAQCSCRGHSS